VLKDGTLTVPPRFAAQHGQIVDILRKLSGRLEIKNADERRQVRTRQAVLHSPEFKALWDRIRHKTTYRVEFDNEKLIESCIRAFKDAPPIAKTRLKWRKADIAIGKSGVEATERPGAELPVVLDEADIELPDLLTDLQDRTQLTRRTIFKAIAVGDNPARFKKAKKLDDLVADS
jgi:type III restriction enzyme